MIQENVKRPVFDYSRLLGKIKEKFGTQQAFAWLLGIGRVSLNQRLKGKMEFTQKEISISMRLLGLSEADIVRYFFTEKEV